MPSSEFEEHCNEASHGYCGDEFKHDPKVAVGFAPLTRADRIATDIGLFLIAVVIAGIWYMAFNPV